MKRSILFAAFVCALSIVGVSQVAYAELSDAGKTTLANLKEELVALDKEFVPLPAAYSALVEEKNRLSAVEDLLKGAVARYQSRLMEHNMRVAEHSSAVENHNSRCSGTFSDRNYVAACNSEASQLNARRAQLNDEAETGRQMRQGLSERVESLSQAILGWTQKAKQYDARRNDLIAQQQQLLARVNSVLEDLKQREKLSVTCSAMNSLESAHACLQRVWDGAK